MRKFKVVKPNPELPPVGTVLYNTNGDGYVHQEGSARWYRIDGYIMEEIKEPEEFWYLDLRGDVVSCDNRANSERSGIPGWLRFNTKESAEKFRDALKESYCGDSWDRRYSICNALNDRVK